MSKKSPAQPPSLNDGGGAADNDNTWPNDISILPHAPATSQGTYMEGVHEGVEPLEVYQDGGYHPVHLGDCYGPSGRYRVLHKLGYGGFGTVWLCRDTLNETYVSLKILASELKSDELVDLTLAGLDHSIPGAEHIAVPLDHFTVEGPNGSHKCLVLPVLGPPVSSVSSRLRIAPNKDAGAVLRGMAHQATEAMNFVHKNQVCHGDFRPANILIKLASLDHLSEEDIFSLLGQPTQNRVRTESGEDLPASSPKYIVEQVDMYRLGTEYLTDQICVIDFGESFSFSSPPEDLGIPENYLPPEVLLEEQDVIGPACDLWALGCTLFEIRQQLPLFYTIYDKDELIAESVRFFGKLPKDKWEKWEARGDWFDEEGKWLRNQTHPWSFELALSKRSDSFKNSQSETRKRMVVSEAEQKLLADLLCQLFSYEPEKRPTAEEVLKHDWFKITNVKDLGRRPGYKEGAKYAFGKYKFYIVLNLCTTNLLETIRTPRLIISAAIMWPVQLEELNIIVNQGSVLVVDLYRMSTLFIESVVRRHPNNISSRTGNKQLPLEIWFQIIEWVNMWRQYTLVQPQHIDESGPTSTLVCIRLKEWNTCGNIPNVETLHEYEWHLRSPNSHPAAKRPFTVKGIDQPGSILRVPIAYIQPGHNFLLSHIEIPEIISIFEHGVCGLCGLRRVFCAGCTDGRYAQDSIGAQSGRSRWTRDDISEHRRQVEERFLELRYDNAPL
ncbi:cmgc kinase [Fusarium albosuccineum]|uniref:EKC/KEOPS complex subunit BUD32 n=1 Tax=Fusarium albosuccineum TaxID=1237068 RepID=A0A8H4PHY7_9HYPO|nr:cmgc kinase [Fusarium albosuccineum]